MKNENILLQLPSGKVMFSGPSVPQDLMGTTYRPRMLNSSPEAVLAAQEIGFSDFKWRGRLNVTVYVNSEFMGNINRVEGALMRFGTEKYAQYDNGVFVALIPKGKRNGIIYQRQSYATVLILEGHGHPSPDAMFTEKLPSAEGISVTTSKYASFDEGWVNDFDAMIDKYIAEKNPVVLGDFRVSKGFNPYDKFQNKVSANVQ
jgi:hypothetical protein